MSEEEKVHLGLKLVDDDDYLKALNVFSELVYEFPSNPDYMSTCLFLLDRIVEANHDFEPETAEQYHFRGLSKFYKEEYHESIADFDRAIKLKPRMDYALKCKAFSLMYLGECRLAIECLLNAVKLNPAGEYFDDLAENYFRLDEKETALLYHEKAIQYSPNNERLWHNYGAHLGKMGQYEKAIEMFDKAIVINPNYDDAIGKRIYCIERKKIE